MLDLETRFLEPAKGNELVRRIGGKIYTKYQQIQGLKRISGGLRNRGFKKSGNHSGYDNIISISLCRHSSEYLMISD